MKNLLDRGAGMLIDTEVTGEEAFLFPQFPLLLSIQTYDLLMATTLVTFNALCAFEVWTARLVRKPG